MKIWAPGTNQVNDENLNQAFAPAAIVDSSVSTATGAIYPDVSAAVAAGHKSIQVNPGTYSGFTLSTDGIRVFCPSKVMLSGNTIIGGAIFSSAITMNSKYCEIENLGVQGVTSTGIKVSKDQNDLKGCWAAQCDGIGILLESSWAINVSRCGSVENYIGIRVLPGGAGDNMLAAYLEKNWITSNDTMGIHISEYGSDTTGWRNVNVERNWIYGNAVASASAGIQVDAGAGAMIVGNDVSGNGQSGIQSHGIRVHTPNTTNSVSTEVRGNFCTGNYGAGISIGTESDDVVVVGNRSRANALGNYQNCTNCPGYWGISTNWHP